MKTECHANLIDTVISAIMYYTSNKNAEVAFVKLLKKEKLKIKP